MIFQTFLLQHLVESGERIAISTENGDITYDQLLKRANKITQALLNMKLPAETAIGISLDNRVDFIAAIIGIANARLVFVPLDMSLPSAKLSSIKEQLDLSYVVASESAANGLSNLKKIPWQEESESLSMQYPAFAEDDALYIYFTSGSTGIPKGVVGKNASLTQFLQWETETFKLDNTTRSSQFISPYFDAFLRDVFVPLVVRGTLCIPPNDEDFFTTEKMIPWINQNEISLIHCVPSLFRVFNSAEHFTKETFQHLRYVMLSGEKIIPAELKPWYGHFGDRVQLVNLYGATETTMVRTFYKIQPEDAQKPKISIGQPIADTEVLVLDEQLRPCNPLITGDLYIVSKYLTKGYLNNEAINHERFVFIEGKGPAFKIGDKGRTLLDESVELLGREDRQVKIRGIRIELDEIEHVLGKAQLAENIVAIKHTQNTSSDAVNESIVAFVKKGSNASDAELVSKLDTYAQEHLASYMVPSRIVAVANFPRLSNGKMDLKALEKLLGDTSSEHFEEATTPTQKKLLAIWKVILGDQQISITDNFLKKGGNSLNLMKLIAKIYAEFEFRIPLSTVFKNLTIEKQAMLLGTQEEESELALQKVEDLPHYQTSAAQRRIYFEYLLAPESTAYNLPTVLKVKKPLEGELMIRAFEKLVQRHESMRTIFRIVNDQVVQEVKSEVSVSLVEEETSDLSTSIQQFIQPFNLQEVPLFRIAVFTTAEKEMFLAFDIHHIICDGVSQMNLFQDFAQLLMGDSIAPLQIQYKDYTHWETQYIETDDYKDQKGFWLESFYEGIPKSPFRDISEKAASTAGSGNRAHFTMDKVLLNVLMHALEDEQLTSSSVMFTVFLSFLSRYTGQHDLVVGVPSIGRVHEETQPIVGMFVKTLPIRYQLQADHSFKSNLKNIHVHLTKAYDNQLFDLSDIIKELNQSGISDRRNLFDIMFSFQNFESNASNEVSDVFESYDLNIQSVKYPLEMLVSEGENTLQFAIEYSKSAVTSVDEVVALFKETFKLLASNPDTPIQDLVGFYDEIEDIAADDLIFNF